MGLVGCRLNKKCSTLGGVFEHFRLALNFLAKTVFLVYLHSYTHLRECAFVCIVLVWAIFFKTANLVFVFVLQFYFGIDHFNGIFCLVFFHKFHNSS